MTSTGIVGSKVRGGGSRRVISGSMALVAEATHDESDNEGGEHVARQERILRKHS